MTRASAGGGWPTPEQELLLRAALLPGEPALAAWRQWQARVDPADLERGSRRLLPLVARNLRDSEVGDAWLGRFAEAYRQTWWHNQALLDHGLRVLRAFRRAGIPTLVLKGQALALLHYRDLGLRPMDDFDVLVPPDQALAAAELLTRSGWAPPPPAVDIAAEHAASFLDDDGHNLDLHRYVLPGCRVPGADDPFWRGAVTLRLRDCESLALNPTDQLLHVCAHGVGWNERVAPLRWVADAMMVLRGPGTDIDWDRLLALTLERRLTPWIREALRYLRAAFDAPIPAAVIERFEAITVPRHDRFLHGVSLQPLGPQRLWFPLRVHWAQHRRAADGAGWLATAVRFPAFLRRQWDLDASWQVPLYMLRKGAPRLLRLPRSVGSRAATGGSGASGSRAGGEGR